MLLNRLLFLLWLSRALLSAIGFRPIFQCLLKRAQHDGGGWKSRVDRELHDDFKQSVAHPAELESAAQMSLELRLRLSERDKRRHSDQLADSRLQAEPRVDLTKRYFEDQSREVKRNRLDLAQDRLAGLPVHHAERFRFSISAIVSHGMSSNSHFGVRLRVCLTSLLNAHVSAVRSS